jgi:hypothetical protein
MSFFDEIKKIFIELFNSFKNEILKEIILIKNLPNDREKELEEINCKLQEEIILLRQELEMLRLEKSKEKIVGIQPWELFNTDTMIRIVNAIDVTKYVAAIDVANEKIIFKNTNFASLGSVITFIKNTEEINPNTNVYTYESVYWYNKQTKRWVSASNTFTRDFLEKNGKQN